MMKDCMVEHALSAWSRGRQLIRQVLLKSVLHSVTSLEMADFLTYNTELTKAFCILNIT